MTKVKYFFIFDKENVKKNFLCNQSLRKGVQYFVFFSFFYLILFFALGLISKQNTIEIIIKFLIYTILDFISINYFLQSTNSFNFNKAYLGLNLLNASIFLHFVLYILKTILYFLTFSKFTFLHFKTSTIDDHSEFYELFYLLVQMFFYNTLFSFTVQLSDGNDALADGQEFDKYEDNFAIDDSISKSRTDTENKNYDKIKISMVNIEKNSTAAAENREIK